jgi:hypothetical protein
MTSDKQFGEWTDRMLPDFDELHGAIGKGRDIWMKVTPSCEIERKGSKCRNGGTFFVANSMPPAKFVLRIDLSRSSCEFHDVMMNELMIDPC